MPLINRDKSHFGYTSNRFLPHLELTNDMVDTVSCYLCLS
jgi:hypothetical protein